MDALECEICCCIYNAENRRPKSLPCTHIFCKQCLVKEIANDKRTCATCRQPHTAETVDDLPYCVPIERLIRNMTETLSMGAKADEKEDDGDADDEDYSGGPCSIHKKSTVYFFCKSHSVKVCRECTVIAHPATKCNIISYKEEIESGKANTIHQVNSTVIDIDDTMSELNYIIKEKKDIISNKQGIIYNKEQEIQQLKNDIEEESKAIAEERIACEKVKNELSNGNEKRKTLEETKNNLQNTNKKNTIARLRIDTETITTDITKWIQDVQTKFDIQQISEEPWKIVKALRKNKIIFAETTVQQTKKIAKFSLREAKLHIHHFSNVSSKKESITVKYDAVLRHLPSQSLVFLDLTHNEKGHQGRIYIKLEHELQSFVKHLPELFIGKNGDSIMRNKGRILLMAFSVDVEKTVNDISSRKAGFTAKIGDVFCYFTDNKISFLSIHTENGHSYSERCSIIGHVEDGLEVAKACKGLGDTEQKNLTISDCGLVLVT